MSETFKKNDVVRYGFCEPGCIEAIVRRAHRDATCTVEATFFIDADGKRETNYLGYRYRIHASDLRRAA